MSRLTTTGKQVAPSRDATGLSVPMGVSAVMGAWVTAVSSVVAGAQIAGFKIAFQAGSDQNIEIEFGAGTTGSTPTPIGIWKAMQDTPASPHWGVVMLDPPIDMVETGQDISVRCAKMGAGGGDTLNLWLLYYEGMTGTHRTTVPYTATSLGAADAAGISQTTTVPANTSSWGWSDWTPIYTDVSGAFYLFGYSHTNIFLTDATLEWEFGTGPDIDHVTAFTSDCDLGVAGSGSGTIMPQMFPAAYPVPGGTFVWARFRKNGTSPGNVEFLFQHTPPTLVSIGPYAWVHWPRRIP